MKPKILILAPNIPKQAKKQWKWMNWERYLFLIYILLFMPILDVKTKKNPFLN